MTVSVVLPTYNERAGILDLLDEVHAQLAAWPHELLVVDDDSPDGTYAAVAAAGRDYVRAFKRTEDRGFAAAIRFGIEQARGDILVIMDSDFNHQPSYLPVLLAALAGHDCVSGSRFMPGGRMDTPLRHWLSWGFNRGVRLLTGSRMTDNLYGYFALRKEVLRPEWAPKVFFGAGDYSMRLLAYLQAGGARIVEVPMVNGKRRHGTGNRRFLRTFLSYSGALLRLAGEKWWRGLGSN